MGEIGKSHKIMMSGDFYLEESVKTSEEMRAPHFHEMFEIYYLISGERNYLVGNRTYKVSPGDLLFIPSHEIHRATNTSVPFHERIVIHFTKRFLAHDAFWLEDAQSPFITGTHLISLPVHLQKRVEELLDRMVIEYRTKDKGFETSIKGALLELLILGLRLNRDAMNKPIAFDRPSHRKISEIIRFINENYEKQITLTLLSEQFYISPFYLSRLFKQTTGFTYVEYLTIVRIKVAQRLLRETKWQIHRIMENVGFRDPAHFGKIFKAICHCTPLQYRKKYRQ
ncbi:AraC family transcriptional regulator [Paenibacillus sp. GYB003]|uniref:AraC family transcriptional regulator n=1 Tax=Paenibacillus sp. GYB003 TaxID=2994392 RepID=UPI002F96D22E